MIPQPAPAPKPGPLARRMAVPPPPVEAWKPAWLKNLKAKELTHRLP